MERVSLQAWLQQDKDLPFLEGATVFILGLGIALVCISVFDCRIPYGRYGSDRKGFFHSIGLTNYKIHAKLAWFVQELPSLVIPLYCLLNVGGKYVGELNPNIVILGMFVLHYFNRVFLFSLTIKGKPTPIAPFLVAFVYTSVNGFVQARYLTEYIAYDLSWFYDPRFIIGHVLFLLGMAINIHSDFVLMNLRKPGETGYKIPYGGMFSYVSSANYFGECLEWTGYAIAGWSWPGLVVAIFSVLFLGARAVQHHQFYQKKFDDYPKNRKAFIPFVL